MNKVILSVAIALSSAVSINAAASSQIPVSVVDNNMYSGGRVQDVTANIVAELTTKAEGLCGASKLIELWDLSVQVKGGGLVKERASGLAPEVTIAAPETTATALAVCE